MGKTYETKFFSVIILGLYFRGKHDLDVLVHPEAWFETIHFSTNTGKLTFLYHCAQTMVS